MTSMERFTLITQNLTLSKEAKAKREEGKVKKAATKAIKVNEAICESDDDEADEIEALEKISEE